MNALARPDLKIRIGFAGNRWGPATGVPDDHDGLREAPRNLDALKRALVEVLETIESRLIDIASERATRARDAGVARAGAPNPPVLRLITGLAEGADQLAADAYSGLPPRADVTREFAAVLPCDARAYRATREPWFRADFDAALKACSYVLVLDGLCDKPVPDDAIAKTRRARAYRAQATYLLRQCDLLVALADPSDDSEAGGTLETVTAAINCQVPVVLVDARSAVPRLVTSSDELSDPFDLVDESTWRAGLRHRLSLMLAGPDFDEPPADARDSREDRSSTAQLIDEFFGERPAPPRTRSGSRRRTWRERLWTAFSAFFHTDRSRRSADGPADETLAPFAAWRQRAVELSYHYTGLYRGAFALNYLLAVVAVALAALSLALMAMHAARGAGHGATPVQVLLALTELLCIVSIYRNTHIANTGNWNDKAIDYRYLSERLRSAFYLPRVGSFRVPEASRAQFTSRIFRQGAVDWLFDVMMRHVSPLHIDELAATSHPSPAAMVDEDRRFLRVDASGALEIARSHWMATQIDYHRRNAIHMSRMFHVMDRFASRLNLFVIAAVAIDLAVLAVGLVRPGIEVVDRVHEAAGPWLLFVGAVVPAAVAALHGIRYQSECRRLADRSSVMEKLLEGHRDRLQALAARISRRRSDPAADPGAWSHDVLLHVEQCARALAEEVTEWSVLYAKEIDEP